VDMEGGNPAGRYITCLYILREGALSWIGHSPGRTRRIQITGVPESADESFI